MAQMDYVEEVTVTKADIDSFHDMLDSQSETIKDAILDVFGNDTDKLYAAIAEAKAQDPDRWERQFIENMPISEEVGADVDRGERAEEPAAGSEEQGNSVVDDGRSDQAEPDNHSIRLENATDEDLANLQKIFGDDNDKKDSAYSRLGSEYKDDADKISEALKYAANWKDPTKSEDNQISREEMLDNKIEYDKAKAKYEETEKKYNFNNFFSLSDKLEFDIMAYRTGLPGSTGKNVSGAQVAMDFSRLMRSNIIESAIEVGLHRLFEKWYPAKVESEQKDVTKGEGADSVSKDGQQESKTDTGDQKPINSSVEQNGFSKDPINAETVKSARVDNPEAGKYAGFDMSNTKVESNRLSQGQRMWESGRMERSVQGVDADGKLRDVSIPKMRLVEAHGNRYLVDPFGKATAIQVTDEKFAAATEKTGFSRLDISSGRNADVFKSIADSSGKTVDQIKSEISNSVKTEYIESRVAAMEKHIPYLEKTADGLRGEVDVLKSKVEAYDKQVASLEVKAADVKAKGGSADQIEADIKQITTAKSYIESDIASKEKQISDIESTIKSYGETKAVNDSKDVDIDTKLSKVVQTEDSAVGRGVERPEVLGDDERTTIDHADKIIADEADPVEREAGADPVEQKADTDPAAQDSDKSDVEQKESGSADPTGKEELHDPAESGVDKDGAADQDKAASDTDKAQDPAVPEAVAKDGNAVDQQGGQDKAVVGEPSQESAVGKDMSSVVSDVDDRLDGRWRELKADLNIASNNPTTIDHRLPNIEGKISAGQRDIFNEFKAINDYKVEMRGEDFERRAEYLEKHAVELKLDNSEISALRGDTETAVAKDEKPEMAVESVKAQDVDSLRDRLEAASEKQLDATIEKYQNALADRYTGNETELEKLDSRINELENKIPDLEMAAKTTGDLEFKTELEQAKAEAKDLSGRIEGLKSECSNIIDINNKLNGASFDGNVEDKKDAIVEAHDFAEQIGVADEVIQEIESPLQDEALTEAQAVNEQTLESPEGFVGQEQEVPPLEQDPATGDGSAITPTQDDAAIISAAEEEVAEPPTLDDIKEAISKEIHGDSNSTFSFKEDFLEPNKDTIDQADLMDAFSDAITDTLRNPDDESTTGMFDKLFDMFNDAFDSDPEALSEMGNRLEEADFGDDVEAMAERKIDFFANDIFQTKIDDVESKLESIDYMADMIGKFADLIGRDDISEAVADFRSGLSDVETAFEGLRDNLEKALFEPTEDVHADVELPQPDDQAGVEVSSQGFEAESVEMPALPDVDVMPQGTEDVEIPEGVALQEEIIPDEFSSNESAAELQQAINPEINIDIQQFQPDVAADIGPSQSDTGTETGDSGNSGDTGMDMEEALDILGY